MTKIRMLTEDWNRLADRRLRRFLRVAESFPGLRRQGPKGLWKASVKLVSVKMVTVLNSKYRGKNSSTDILSFSAEFPFRDAGFLGELVVCLPVLKSQAVSLGHSPRRELDVLLVHGILHLLGLDHEKGPLEAARMARWELALLKKSSIQSRTKSSVQGLGLINRSKLDME